MTPPSHGEPMRIGEVLKRARTRQGIEIRTVEERTKIRTKYLRALEAEDWEVLPSPAYAKGFLRTYAQLLGLDADAVIDEFRDRVESQLDAGHPLRLSEPLLEGRRRLADRGSRGPGTLVAVVVAVAVGILLLVGLLGGDDEGGDPERRPAAGREHDGGRSAAPRPGEPAVLRLSVRREVQICLLSGAGEVLIDGQSLSPGTEERFRRDRFELRFPGGYEREQFQLTLGRRPVRLPDAAARAAFEIEPGSPVRPLERPGRGCP